jgi:hypothetical protein
MTGLLFADVVGDAWSLWQTNAAEAECLGEDVEVAIHVQDVGAMLLSARADHEIGKRDTVPTARGQLALGTFGGGDRRVVDAQVPVGGEVLLQPTPIRARSPRVARRDLGPSRVPDSARSIAWGTAARCQRFSKPRVEASIGMTSSTSEQCLAPYPQAHVSYGTSTASEAHPGR